MNKLVNDWLKSEEVGRYFGTFVCVNILIDLYMREDHSLED